MQIDYKNKYKELKAKIKEITDLAFRLGVEEGMRQGQVQQAQDQAAQAQDQAQQLAMAHAQGGQPGQNGQPGQPGGKPPFGKDQETQGSPAGAQAGPSELDSHISELESLLQKMEKDSEGYRELRKSIDGLTQMNNSRKAQIAIDGIAAALKKPFTLGAHASKNMNLPAQKSLSMQEQLVQDMMKEWGEQEKATIDQVNKTLSVEGILNKG